MVLLILLRWVSVGFLIEVANIDWAKYVILKGLY